MSMPGISHPFGPTVPFYVGLDSHLDPHVSNPVSPRNMGYCSVMATTPPDETEVARIGSLPGNNLLVDYRLNGTFDVE